MALSAQSLIVYGLEVTTLNQNIDFKIASLGAQLTAIIPLGFYSITGLASQIITSMSSVDSAHTYTVTVDRTVMGGTENRVMIATTGTFLSLLFGSGTNATKSLASLVGFNEVDYTGSTHYSGAQSTGTPLVPDYIGYNYNDDMNTAKVFGAVNVAASGVKEAITFNIQYFIEVNFMHEKKSNLAVWKSFFLWAIQQRPFDFTPEISNPNLFYQVTLESTTFDSKGLAYQMKEELPNFPNFFQTGLLKFRIIIETSQFISGG